MNESQEIAKGRAKEAAGSQFYNDLSRGRGQTDQAMGSTMQDAKDDVPKADDEARSIAKKAKDVENRLSQRGDVIS